MEPFDVAQDRHPKSIVVLDFGGQYAHLIARRVRQCGVYAEILPPETLASELGDVAGVILSGGPQSVYNDVSPQGDPKIFDLGVPVLGICYGLQWMAHTLGGEVKEGHTKEYGRAKIVIEDSAWQESQGVPKEFTVWMSHGDEVAELPAGFSRVGTSESCKNAAIYHAEKNILGVQFHPEVTHSEYGEQLIRSFVEQCDAAEWSIESYAKYIGEQITEQVGDRKVFMLVSGGVDSTVAFTLLNQVLGADRVQGLLVDHGMMRLNEVADIQEAFDELNITNLRVEEASEKFMSKLAGVYDPEQKRQIIGQTFLDVQKRVSEEMGLRIEDGWMLGQGTIYPDTIETGETKNADKIKTHHNRIDVIQQLMSEGLVIEPLRELYKDEVRLLGEELGLPHELVWRHPFPGPGLGVRILCAKDPEPVEANVDIPVTYAPLPIKSVGVQGDGRTYRHAIALFNTSKTPTMDCWDIATSIPNQHSEFSRVLMCISHEKPPTFVFSPGYITLERADVLRQADAVVHDTMKEAGLYESIWQFPVVLLPFGTSEGGQSIVLRPVASQEAMTANAVHLPDEVLLAMTTQILAIDGIDVVFQDLTHKPPGTIEWE